MKRKKHFDLFEDKPYYPYDTKEEFYTSMLSSYTYWGTPLDKIRYAIEQGANVNDELTMMFAALRDRLDVVKLLVSYGAIINNNAFYAAVDCASPELVEYMIDNGANVKAFDSLVVKVAKSCGWNTILQKAIEKGANPDATWDYV